MVLDFLKRGKKEQESVGPESAFEKKEDRSKSLSDPIMQELDYYESQIAKLNELHVNGKLEEADSIAHSLYDKIENDSRFNPTSTTQYYCYSNEFEEALIEILDNRGKIIAKSPLPYDRAYLAIGSLLIDLKHYGAAEVMLEKAMTWAPANMNVRFEYMELSKIKGRMKEYAFDARMNAKYIQTFKDAARYYRSLAYFYSDKAEYEIAAALSLKSMQYEQTELAIRELEYDEHYANKTFSNMSPEQIDDTIAGFALVDPFELSAHVALEVARNSESRGDPGRAESIYRTLVDQDDFLAQCFLSDLLRRQGRYDGFFEKTLKSNLNLAENNHPAATYAVGICYYYGFGVELSKEKAFEWFDKSASLRYFPGALMASNCCERGIGTGVDREKALRYLAIAWLKGSGVAAEKVDDIKFVYDWHCPVYLTGYKLDEIPTFKRKRLLDADPLDETLIDKLFMDGSVITEDTPTVDETETGGSNADGLYKDESGLYPHEILMISMCSRYKVGDRDFPGYWRFTYFVEDPVKLIDSLIDRGFIKVSRDPIDLLNRRTLQDIKDFRLSLGLKGSGKKENLIKRTIEEVPEETIQDAFPESIYVPSEKGQEVLANNFQVRALHDMEAASPLPFNVYFKGKGCRNKWEFIKMCIEWIDHATPGTDVPVSLYIKDQTEYKLDQIKYFLETQQVTNDGKIIPSHTALFFTKLYDKKPVGPEYWEGLFSNSATEEYEILEEAGLVDRTKVMDVITPQGSLNYKPWAFLGEFQRLDYYGISLVEAQNYFRNATLEIEKIENPVNMMIWNRIHDKATKPHSTVREYQYDLFMEYQFLTEIEQYGDAFIRLFACIGLEINQNVEQARMNTNKKELTQFKKKLEDYLDQSRYYKEFSTYDDPNDKTGERASMLFELSMRATEMFDVKCDPAEYWMLFHTKYAGQKKQFREAIDRVAKDLWEDCYIPPSTRNFYRSLAEKNSDWVNLDDYYTDGRHLTEVLDSIRRKDGQYIDFDLYSVIRDSRLDVWFDTPDDLEEVYGMNPLDLKVGQRIESQKDMRLRPVTVTNDKGKEFLPLFTDREAVPSDFIASHQIVFNQAYEDCIEVAKGMKLGIVVNPFTDCITIPLKEAIFYTAIPTRLKNADDHQGRPIDTDKINQ